MERQVDRHDGEEEKNANDIMFNGGSSVQENKTILSPP